MTKPIKLEGRGDWATDDRTIPATAAQHVVTAVLSADSLGIDANYEGRAFTGTLSRNHQTWNGVLRTHDGMVAEVSGKLYQEHSTPDEWLFFGKWLEEGVEYVFWIDLEAEDSN